MVFVNFSISAQFLSIAQFLQNRKFENNLCHFCDFKFPFMLNNRLGNPDDWDMRKPGGLAEIPAKKVPKF